MAVAQRTFAAFLIGFPLMAAFPAAHAGTWRAGFAADYTSGEYGSTDTITQAYVPFSAGYSTERWSMRLTVPYIRVDGPGTVIDPDGEFVSGPDRSRSGLGDVIFGATLYDLVAGNARDFHLDIATKVKFGTADEADGLGTGETDYSLQADLLKDFGRFALFATAGYKWRGDPDPVDLRDGTFGMIGADYRLADHVRLGLLYDYRESAINGADAPSEATLYLSFSRSHVSFQPYVVAGLSDSSPDWGAGLSVGWRPKLDR